MNDFTKEELQIIHLDMTTYINKTPMLNESPSHLALRVKVQSMIDNYCEDECLLEERISGLEQWAINHDVEGMAYGKEFEERDAKLIDRIERLEKLLNLTENA